MTGTKLYRGSHTPKPWLHYRTRAHIAQKLFETGYTKRLLEGHEIGNVSNFRNRRDEDGPDSWVWTRPDVRGGREEAIILPATTLESWLAEKPNDDVPLKGTAE